MDKHEAKAQEPVEERIYIPPKSTAQIITLIAIGSFIGCALAIWAFL